ncbi:MAG: hypothetical protein LBD08_06060, partial [Treponema sp.]|nr:hypothetical protein [Treponema sp.]
MGLDNPNMAENSEGVKKPRASCQGVCIYFPKITVNIYSGFIAAVKRFFGPLICFFPFTLGF